MAEPGDSYLDGVLSEVSQAVSEYRQAEYFDAVTSFRASALELFRRFGFTSTDAWLYFSAYETNGVYTNFPSPVTVEYFTVLSGVSRPHYNKGIVMPPSIRIFKKARIDRVRGRDYIVEDSAVDYENDSQYLMDAIFFSDEERDDDGDFVGDPEFNEARKIHNLMPAIALPWVDESGLGFLTNPGSFPPVGYLYGAKSGIGSTPSIAPFGHHWCFEDANYALGKASSMLAACLALEPDRSGIYDQV